MRSVHFLLFLLLLLCSCSKKILFQPTNYAETHSFPDRDSVSLEISQAHQTKKTIGFEVEISNQSSKKVFLDPFDFYCTPQEPIYSIESFDPEFLHFLVEHPFVAATQAAYWDWGISGGEKVDFTVLAEIYLTTNAETASLSAIQLLYHWNQIKDFKKVLIHGLLESQYLEPGGSRKGLIYFPKKAFKKLDAVYINWERKGQLMQSIHLTK